jgi:PAS domain S-box-containing protein
MGATKDKSKSTADGLRRQAEKQFHVKKAHLPQPLSKESSQRMVHELEVHQIELEMQNAELTQAREELELSRNKYLELYDFAPVGYFTFDARGLIKEANLTGAKLLGIERRAVANKPFSRFIADEERRDIFLKHLDAACQKQGNQVCEIRLKKHDGTPFCAEFQSIAMESAGDKAVCIHTTIIDITEQKKWAYQIEHLSSFPELNPNPVIETDLKGEIIYCNNATRKMLKKLNLPEDGRLFLPHDFTKVIKELRQEKNERYTLREVEINDRVFVESIIAPARLNVVRLYAWDITHRKRAEDGLKKAHDEMETRVKERTTELQAALVEIKEMKDHLEAENIYFREEHKMKHRFDHIIGQSDGLKYVLYRAEHVAPINTTVLILGETGTGKELIAAAIHAMSPRKDKPLITVNCAALPVNLIESELFGREKGAFTGADARRMGRFEIANGSTICLDEIGELPLDVQAKLLRVIQHNEFERLGSSNTVKVDVRIVATTNRNLEKEVLERRFREDLYYRLNVFPITVPPLRMRKDDIPLMVKSFMERYSRKLGKQITKIQKETMKMLQDYPWPGNVRELESIIERAVILCPGPFLQLVDKLEITDPQLESVMRSLKDAERGQILKILTETKWRIEGKDGAAAILGIHPSTLRARLHKLEIERPDTKE